MGFDKEFVGHDNREIFEEITGEKERVVGLVVCGLGFNGGRGEGLRTIEGKRFRTANGNVI